VRGMLWMSWGKAGRALLQIVVLAALARLVAPRDFGLVSAAFVVISFTAVLTNIGMGRGLVQHPSLRDDHIAVALHTSVLLSLLFAAITWLFAAEFARFFRIEALAPVLRIMAFAFPLKGIATVPESLLQREFRFRWLANRELASYAIGYGCVGVLLALAGWGAWALVSAYLAQTAANTLLLFLARPIPLAVWPDRQAFRDLLYFSGGYTLGRIANQLASEGDNFVVGRSLGPVALGLYGRAFQLMAVPADIFGDILDSVLFPTLARAQKDAQRLAGAYRRGVSLVALVTLPTSVAFCLLAQEIVTTVLGPRWTSAVLPFQFLALGLLFRTGCRISDALTRARGFVYGRAWRQGFYAGCVLGGAWLGQFWGVAGAAFGVLLALCLNFFLMAQLSLKIARLSWRTFFGAHIPAVLLASSTGVAVQVTSLLVRHWSFSPLALLVGTMTVAACTVFALAVTHPQFFIGSDALWMFDTLRAQFPTLRRLPLPLSSEVHSPRG
jgi:O-antigen/teichoic acid export membrane protein